GYTTGDAVLVELARRMHTSTRTTDLLARVGGDEFMALLPATPEGIAVQMAERLRVLASGPLPGREDVRITCSISVAAVPLDVSSLEQVIGLLQGGVRRSKAHGKNRVSGATNEVEIPGLALTLTAPSSFEAQAPAIVDLEHGMHVVGHHLQP